MKKQMGLFAPELSAAARDMLEKVADEPVDESRVSRVRRRVAAAIGIPVDAGPRLHKADAELGEAIALGRKLAPKLAMTQAPKSCAHDRLLVFSKSTCVCVVCGVRMKRDRGDWRAS